MAESDFPDFHQKILLSGDEYAHTVHGFEVKICASTLSSIEAIGAGSSKVKISTITNQNWECPSHNGKMVASNNEYLLYVVEGRNGHVLRLLQQGSNSRALLKGFVGAVEDVAFHHANSNLLACVDQGGNLFIWDLDKCSTQDQIQTDAALKIVIHRSSTPVEVRHRLVWSPHVPLPEEEEEDQEVCNVILTYGSDIEVLDLHEIFSTYGRGMKVPREQLRCGCYCIPGAHEKGVCDLSLSPDGSVLATVGEDGHLKFWQVDWECTDSSGTPKCLHDFVPHNGSPVTRLIFCDNRLSQDPGNQYWRFLITAAKNNCDVKIWCAVNWKCLQTIRFLPPEDDGIEPHMILDLDPSASYLVAADSKRKAVLLLQLSSSPALGDASVTSVTEYLLTQPIFSFTVSGSTAIQASGEDSSEEEEEEEDTYRKEFDSRRNVVLLKLHCVHPKSMQELVVRFEPPDLFGVPPSNHTSGKTLDNDNVSASSGNTDMSLSVDMTQNSSAVTPFQSVPLLSTFGSSPKLLTPSEFTSPTKLEGGSAPTLLSPASIMAMVTEDQQPATILPSSLPQDYPPAATPPTGQTPPPTGLTPIPAATPLINLGQAAPPTDLGQAPAATPTTGLTQAPAATPSTGLTQAPAATPTTDLTQAPAATPSTGLTQTPAATPPTGLTQAASPTDLTQPPEAAPPTDLTPPPGAVPLTNLTRAGISEQVSSDPLLADLQDSFTQVSSCCDKSGSASPLPSACAEKLEYKDSIVHCDSIKDDFKPEKLPLPLEMSSEDDEMPNTEDTRKAFDSILELLGGDKSVGSDLQRPVEPQQASFSAEDPEPEVAGNYPEIGLDSSHSKSSYPDVLRSTSDPDLPPEDPGVIESRDNDSHWPDIGALALPNDGVAHGEGIAKAIPVKETISTEFGVEVDNSQFPSAELEGASDLQDIQNNIMVDRELTLAPDILEQDISAAVEAEDGSLKSKSKQRKRSRRIKKQNICQGATEVLDPPSHSDGNTCSAGVDLLPSASNLDLKPPSLSPNIFQLSQLVMEQQKILCELRSEQERSVALVQEQFAELRKSVIEEHKAVLSEMKVEQQQKLDRILKDKQLLDKQKQDKLITTLSNTLTTAVNAKLDKLVKTEMKNTILPVVQQSVSLLQEKFTASMASQLAAADTAVKDGIDGLVAVSKELPNTVAVKMTTSLHQSLPSVCEEIFKSTIMPSFERSCQEMFRQIDDSFRRGTLEYLGQFQQQKQQQSMQESALHYLLSSVENLQSSVGKSMEASAPDRLQSLIHHEVSTLSQQMKDMLTGAIVEIVHREIDAKKVSQTSQQKEDIKGQIQKLIQSHSYNSAFELTLSTSDLQLVIYLCQQVDPDTLFFKPPLPLSQPVLLSLIQQLSVNLEENLELKLKYVYVCVSIGDTLKYGDIGIWIILFWHWMPKMM